MTPKWYSAGNKITKETRTFRSNNPLGVAFEMLGGGKYSIKEISENHWLIDEKLEVKEINNINPHWSLK